MDMNNFTWNEKEYGCPLIFLLRAAKDLVIDNDFDSCSFLFGDLTMLFEKTWIFYDNFRNYRVLRQQIFVELQTVLIILILNDFFSFTRKHVYDDMMYIIRHIRLLYNISFKILVL